MHVLSRKQESWTLRLVANGRLVQFEGFRNRQEAYLWSSLSRKIFIKSTDVDIARTTGHLRPPAQKDDWDEKRKGLDRLVDKVFDLLRQQMPKHTTDSEALQDQVEQLLEENEKLKAASAQPRLLCAALPTLVPRRTLRRFAWKSPRPRSLLPCHARVALWTVTSAHHLRTPTNTRRTSLPRQILCSLTSLVIADQFWKTPPPENRPRVRLTSGSRPTSRRRLALSNWRNAPPRSTRSSPPSRLTIWTHPISAAWSLLGELDPSLAQKATANALVRMLATTNALVA